MSQADVEVLETALWRRWSRAPSAKAKSYVGQFVHPTRIGTKITARVRGNHGTYTVSIQVEEQGFTSACSCYIGRHGHCHHCEALAKTFLKDASIFKEVKTKKVQNNKYLTDLSSYLQGTTLDALLQQLKVRGMTQKALAESIGMNTRHLASIKSSELRHHYYNELGATKLACLWVLEHLKPGKTK